MGQNHQRVRVMLLEPYPKIRALYKETSARLDVMFFELQAKVRRLLTVSVPTFLPYPYKKRYYKRH